MFKFFSSKKELDITDALNKKRATITIGGESVVIEAFKLGKALELFAALGNATELVKLAGGDITALNRALLVKMPVILHFCIPGKQIDPDRVTLAEFADLLLAVWCVNDLERIFANFYRATQSIPHLTQGLAALQK